MEPAVLAIDIGGTKLALGLVDTAGKILQREEIPTRATEGPERVLARMVELARTMRDRANPTHAVRRVGIACAGPLDREAGLILNPPNLPGWTRINLVEQVERALGLPAVLDNDANAAALGEFRYGAGRGARSLVYLTVSTGIGGGIILNGRLWHGFGDSAGEIGHMTIDPAAAPCGCGNQGCLEALASGPAIARSAREALRGGRPSRLRDLPEVTAADVVRLACEGDPLAAEVWAAAVHALALGVGAAITILAPERVILGGGVAQAGDALFVPLRREVHQRVKLVAVESVPILPAALGRDVGILGAAALALDPDA